MKSLRRCLLLVLFTLALPQANYGAQPQDIQLERQERVKQLEEEIYELDRKRRKHRLWSSHYQREARRLMSKDLNLYRTRMRQSEDNRVKARMLMDQIVALEEEKRRAEESLETVR